MKGQKMTVDGLIRIFANPYYCIDIDPFMAGDHPKMVSKKEWIECAKQTIDECGLEKFLKYLLENLEGKYI